MLSKDVKNSPVNMPQFSEDYIYYGQKGGANSNKKPAQGPIVSMLLVPVLATLVLAAEETPASAPHRTPAGINGLKTDPPTANCTYPNTQPGYRGQCHCKANYVGDNPLTERGCWKCDPQCHPNAACEYPGRCLCKYGLVGDGTSKCDPPIPSLTSADPLPGTVIASYNAPFDFWPFLAFCQFNGNIRVTAALYPNRSIECLVPQNVSGLSSLRISFSGADWSDSLQISAIPVQHAAPRRTAVPFVVSSKHRPPPPAPRSHAKFIHLAIAILFTIGYFYASSHSPDLASSLWDAARHVPQSKIRQREAV